jgi:hypothetical protein
MFPSVLMGVVYQTCKFANQSFDGIFSISMNMFAPCTNNEEGYAMAVRTLKDVPLKEFFFDGGAKEVLRDATLKSIAKSSDRHHDDECSYTPPDDTMKDSSSNSNTNTNTNKDDNHTPFHFVDMKYAPDLQQTSARLRPHCTSELSALFGMFQVHAAMRAGPIISRTFRWAITYYEAAEMNYETALPVSLKAQSPKRTSVYGWIAMLFFWYSTYA